MRPRSITAILSASCIESSRCTMATTVVPWIRAASERSTCREAEECVEQRGGLVQDEGVRIGQQQPGEGELLGGERVADIARPRSSCPVRRAADAAGPKQCGLQRGPQLLVRAVLLAGEHEVVPQAAAEDVLLLGHQDHLAAELADRQVAEVGAADPYGAAGGVVHASSSLPRVDLPAPEAPTTARRSAGASSRSMPLSTSRPGP